MSKPQEAGHVTYRCTYRVAWCTYRRRPVLDGPPAVTLRGQLAATAAAHGAALAEVDIRPDQVRLLVVACDPQYGIHRLVRNLKAGSSPVLRRDFPALRSRIPVLWTRSYYVATIGRDSQKALDDYADKQFGA